MIFAKGGACSGDVRRRQPLCIIEDSAGYLGQHKCRLAMENGVRHPPAKSALPALLADRRRRPSACRAARQQRGHCRRGQEGKGHDLCGGTVCLCVRCTRLHGSSAVRVSQIEGARPFPPCGGRCPLRQQGADEGSRGARQRRLLRPIRRRPLIRRAPRATFPRKGEGIAPFSNELKRGTGSVLSPTSGEEIPK